MDARWACPTVGRRAVARSAYPGPRPAGWIVARTADPSREAGNSEGKRGATSVARDAIEIERAGPAFARTRSPPARGSPTANEMEFKRETRQNLIQTFATGDVDGVTVAGLVWLFRRRHGERTLRFETAAQQLKCSDLDTIEMTNEIDETASSGAGVPEVVTGPEA
jgi:hypothetical protein